MVTYPDSDLVLASLGDKVVDAFTNAVALAREDLSTYRLSNPLWVAEHSERGLAGWIHDRLWARLVELLSDNPDVFLHESGPTRDVIVSDHFRIRVKRHDSEGNVASYPTQGAIQFFAQPDMPAFEGLDQVHLIVGYCWTSDLRDMGAAVLSLRDGKDNVIWLTDLDARATGLSITTVQPPVNPPIAPEISAPVAPTIQALGADDVGAEETA
jgi:hypothetical protein